MTDLKPAQGPKKSRVEVVVFWLMNGLLVLFAGLLALHPIKNYDIWWHIKSGDWILKNGYVPLGDPFSFVTSGFYWHNHEWGLQCLMSVLHRLHGLDALIVAKAVVVMVSLVFLIMALKRSGTSHGWQGWVVLIYILLTPGYWLARPQVVEYGLMIALIWLLTSFERRQRVVLIVLPIFFLIWVNLHASFILGLFLLYLVFIEQWIFRLKRTDNRQFPWFRELSLIVFITTGLTLANPVGIQAWLYPFHHYKLKYTLQTIIEWQAPPLLSWVGISVIVLGSVGLIAAILFWRKVQPAILVMMIVTAVLSLNAVKHFPLFIIFIVALFGQLLARRAMAFRFTRAGNCISMVLLMMLVFYLGHNFYTYQGAGRLGVNWQLFPVGAARFIKETRPAANIYNYTQDGGVLIYYLWPDYKVFVDGRLVLFGDELMREANEIISGGPLFKLLLERYKIRTALVRYRFDDGSVGPGRKFHEDPEWAMVYLDAQFAVFLQRTEPRNQPIISHYEYKVLSPYEPTCPPGSEEDFIMELQRAHSTAGPAP